MFPGSGCELLTYCSQLMLSPFSDINSLLPSILPSSLLLSQYSRLHACVESAGARSQLVTSQSNTSLQSLVTDQSFVLAVDNDVMAQLKTEEQSWVEQVNNFLRRYI